MRGHAVSVDGITLHHPCIQTWERFPVQSDVDLKVTRQLQARIDAFLVYDLMHYKEVVAQAWTSILAATYPWVEEQGWLLREVLLALCLRVLHHRALGNSCLDFIEYYAGSGELSRAAIGHGLCGLAFDVMYSPDHDALTPEGLRLYLAALAGTKPGALIWHGTPCSSFVVLCRSVSLRDECNDYAGDESRLFVRVGNGLAAVTALTSFLADLVGAVPVLEQPLNSCLPMYSLMNCILTFLRCRKFSTYLGAFEGPTLKPLQLLSTSLLTMKMCRQKPEAWQFDGNGLVTRDSKGFTGRKMELKCSEAYTPAFARAVLETFFQ